MRILVILFTLFCALIACKEQHTNSYEKSPLYPHQLEFGEYGVGLQTLWLYDESRKAVPYSDWHGKLYPTEETKGRQFQVNIWYPSGSKGPGAKLRLEHYLDLSYRQTNFVASVNGAAFGKSELRNKLVDLGGLDSLNSEDYNKLAELPVLARENSPPAEGEFPVVLFPTGMSPVSNSTTAEYLASHGIAVVGFTAMGKDASIMNASSQGIDTATDDISFVLGEVLKIPFINNERIGLMGNAIESSFCAAYLSKNRKINAFVSLEGGFISNFEQTLLEKLPYYQPENINIPLLLIYSPHPSIKPSYIEKLEFSDRYFAHLPSMREFDYLNFGLWDSLVPGIIGENRGDVRQGFASAHKLILQYFDTALNQNPELFADSFRQLNDPAIDTSFVWRSKPNIPPLVEIKDGFIRQGLPYLESIYKAQKDFTEKPFSKSFFTDFTNWVAWKKDPDYTTRQWLMEIAVKDYPISAIYSYDLAYYASRTGDSTLAQAQYKQVLRKLPDDPDVSLTVEQKARIRSDALLQLEKLK